MPIAKSKPCLINDATSRLTKGDLSWCSHMLGYFTLHYKEIVNFRAVRSNWLDVICRILSENTKQKRNEDNRMRGNYKKPIEALQIPKRR